MRLLTPLWLVASLCCLATAWAQPAPPPASRDVVLIVGMTPPALVDGIESEVEVTVAYVLDARDEGLLELASNTVRPQGYSPFASQRVPRGSGTIVLRGKLTPRFWTANIVPKIAAYLVVPGDELTQRKSLAADHKTVAVGLRPNPAETYAANPNPSVVYEDGVRIKSISPATFFDGQAVDVEVVVAYELLSRETGELSLGFSQGRANAYSSSIRQQVQAGKAEVTLRARVVPTRTSGLPFMKIHVGLSEFPKRPRNALLGSDSETVEVR